MSDNTEPAWLTKMRQERHAETLALLEGIPAEEARAIADAASAAVEKWGRSLDARTTAYYEAAFADETAPEERP